jgi:hypothetical protein
MSSELWIRICIGIQHFKRIRIRIQGVDKQKLKKKIPYTRKLCKTFFAQKLQFTYVQATGDAFGPQKNIQHFKKLKILNFFLCLLAIFALLDPYPQHWISCTKI